MTDFNEIKYERIDFDKTKTNLENLVNQLKNTDDFDAYISIVQRINDIQLHIEEMFSYAMELIMMDQVRNIFEKDDYKKYCFMKIYSLVEQLPYICLVDEFQQLIYSKENLEIPDIKSIWLELASKYHLEKSNSGHINLDNGGYFYRQSHIYLDPFYYIDYALSYFGAFAIWNNCKDDIELFKEIGGVASYYAFSDLIDKYNMPNPFSKDTVKDIALKLSNELNDKRLVRKCEKMNDNKGPKYDNQLGCGDKKTTIVGAL